LETTGRFGREGFGFATIMLLLAFILLASVGAYLYLTQVAQNSVVQSNLVQVVGSESMRPAVTACAEDFMTRNPDADIVVKGGGSGDGIAALLHGIVDIGMTSRELSQREREYAASRGFDVSTFAVALDGVSIVVNRANRVASLDFGQLRGMFSGKIHDWGELEAGGGEILPFARAIGSGTASLFGERVLGEEAYADSVRRLPTNEAIVAEVAARAGAIGYTGLGALRGVGDKVRVVALGADSRAVPVMATPESVVSAKYPLSRRLYLATAGPPVGAAKAFIDFCLSANGQALFERVGYIAVESAVQ
jgi:phosphate transport system substrate-binding protein